MHQEYTFFFKKIIVKCSKNATNINQKCRKNATKMRRTCRKKIPQKWHQRESKNVPKIYQNVRKSGTTMVVKCAQKWGSKNGIKMCSKVVQKRNKNITKINTMLAYFWWLWPKTRQIGWGSN